MSIEDYWNSTIDDINIMIEAKNQRDKELLRARYETCKLNAYFVGMAMSGKDIPNIESVYPGLFDNETQTEAEEEAAIKYYEKQFAMLATTVNCSRKGK